MKLFDKVFGTKEERAAARAHLEKAKAPFQPLDKDWANLEDRVEHIEEYLVLLDDRIKNLVYKINLEPLDGRSSLFVIE